MRQRMVRGAFQFGAALAEHPVLDLLHELRAFFHDGLVGGVVHVVGTEAELFKRIEELVRGEGAGFGAEFFGDGNADSRRGMRHNNERRIGEHLFHFVHEAHLFDGIERAGNEALTAGKALLVIDLVLGTDAAVNGVNRADLAAGVAGFAQILVDLDNTAQFTLAQRTDKIRTIFAAAAGLRGKGLDFDCFSCHFDGSPDYFWVLLESKNCVCFI